MITAGTMIRIPVGTDVYTLQFMFTLLAGLILGARLGAITVTVYVIMGLIGIPVFASGGGLSYVLQPTFGYLIGFIIQAYFCGFAVQRLSVRDFKHVFMVNVVGMIIVYIIGITWFYIDSNYIIDAPITLWLAILYCGILQVLPDLLLCAAAAFISIRLNKLGFGI